DLTDLNGNIEIKNNDAAISELSGKKGSSDFEINGVIKNFIPYALKENQHINIVASLVSNKIQLEDFLNFTESEKDNGKKSEFYFPDRINFNLDASIKHLSFGAFEAKK